MLGRFERLLSPGGIAAVLLCLAFPVAWNAFCPELADDSLTVRLTRPRSADTIDIPENAITARRIDFKARENEQLLAFAFEVPRAGSYSVYGISANRRAQPLELRVHGRAVSANAFFQKTGKMREGFERHLIARGVAFHSEENSVVVSGTRAMFRTLLLELRQEEPLHPLRYTALAVAAAFLLAIRHVFVRRSSLTPRSRLTLAVALFGAALAAFPAVWFGISDGQLVPLGYLDPVKTERLKLLEMRMNSEEHRRAVEEKFNVFVMGDSTHYWSLPPEHHLVAAIRRSLAAASQTDVEVYGLAGGALNAFDFYLLLNRIAREKPDLVIVPLSLRSFSDRWLQDRGYQFHGMDHYPGPAELLRARNLAVAGRELTTVGWLLRKFDAAFFRGNAGHLLRGVQSWFQAEKERIELEIERTAFATWTPVPAEVQLDLIPLHAAWNTHIPPDHPLFEAFRLINRFAARHGIELLYYTEQVNVSAQREKGNDIRIRENFATIERAVTGGAGVHFLMLSDRNPPEIFSDDVDHLTPDGIEALADALVRETLAIRRAGQAKASAPGQ
jgi:hypothetical protein